MELGGFSKALLLNSLGNYKAAFQAVETENKGVDSLIAKAIILINLGHYTDAIHVLDSIEQTHQSAYVHLLTGKAYFLNQQNEKAMIEAQKAVEFSANLSDENEKEETKHQAEVLIRKIHVELNSKHTLGNINDAAYMPSSKPIEQKPVPQPKVQGPPLDPKYDWYQNATHTFLSFKVGSPEVSQEAKISFEPFRVLIDYKDGEAKIELELANEIIPDQSSKTASSKKIELKLKKSQDNVNWMALEKGEAPKLMATQSPLTNVAPSYPSSAKTHKDWGKIDHDIEKDLAKEKPEGEAALNSLFKQIYDRSDENTRKAMIKSYQTSGGTVLSTNWDEVAKKDYEGKDRPDPVDGTEWRKNDGTEWKREDKDKKKKKY